MPGSALLTIFLLLPAAQTPAGAVWYVSPTGSDANPGSELQPFRTIQKGADVAGPADTVLVRAGVYAERVVVKSSGMEGAAITFRAYPGESPVIDGSGIQIPNDWGGLIDASYREHITVEGFEVRNSSFAGLFVAQGSHVVFRDNHTWNTVSSGLAAWNSTDISLIGNEVRLACNDGPQECITIAGTQDFLVMENHVHEGGPATNGGEGIDVKGGSSDGLVIGNHVHGLLRVGIYLDAFSDWTHGIDVVGNEVHDCRSGIGLSSENGGLLEDVKVSNNLVYSNDVDSGIILTTWGQAATHPMRDLWIVNNTVHGNANLGIAVQPNPDRGFTVIRNNICADNAQGQIRCQEDLFPDILIDHNLSFGVAGWEETLGRAHVWADPRFKNPAAADFHLLHGSPAMDAGAFDGAPNADLEGNSRRCGAAVDLGALERCRR